jgi:methylase of polypeptide subunit release factors
MNRISEAWRRSSQAPVDPIRPGHPADLVEHLPRPDDTTGGPTSSHVVSVTTFGGLVIAADERSLQPRPWTIVQSQWLAELSAECPEGPILELCAGVGHIGLEAARLTGRSLVQVEHSVGSCEWAQHNAARNGLGDRVDVRLGDMLEVLAAGERFPLILADPPYVPSDEVANYPDDPVHAIDGGFDGLALLRRSLVAIRRHLDPQGAAILQVRGYRQAMLVKDELLRRGPDLSVPAVRSYGPTQALMMLRAWY